VAGLRAKRPQEQAPSAGLTAFKSPSPLMVKISRMLGVRHGHRTGSTLLGVHQIATVPTGAVFWLACGFGVALYYSSKFQVNVGYAMAFGGFTMLMTSAWFSFFSMRGVRMTARPVARACHAGETMRFQIEIEETLGRKRRDLILHAGRQQFAVSVGARSCVTVEFDAPTQHRGSLLAPMIKLSTLYPMGLWNTHHLWTPLQEGDVYPLPEDNAPPLQGLESESGDGGSSSDLNDHGDALVSMRQYRAGDSPKRVAWRTFAKTDGRVMATKQSQSGAQRVDDLWVDEAAVAHIHHAEQRLSRLCAWLHQAHDSGQTYGFKACGVVLEPTSGPDHLHQCLRLLAMAAGAQKIVAFENATTPRKAPV
jgi:uncharacterized protein (DUF58 family)